MPLVRRDRRPTRAIAMLLALIAVGCGSDAPSASALVSVGAGLQGPAGVQVEVYATGLTHVAAFAFDGSERLWVATAGSDDAGTDAVYLVTAKGATPQKVLASHTPLGLLWIDDMLYVSSKERVDAYTDFDGTTFASSREVVSFASGTGEDNGLALSPDGRIVLGISSPCDACDPEPTYSAAVVSFLPDGSDVRVDVSGVRAAIALAYRPGTDDLFVTMNQRDDLAEAAPGDWLSVVSAGQDWRFPECYGQGGSVCRGVPEPTAVLDAHAAVSGVAFVPDGLSPSTAKDTAVVAEWATGKVLSVALTGTGAATRGTVSPYLTGFENPVALGMSPAGALYVGDWTTGKVYAVSAA